MSRIKHVKHSDGGYSLSSSQIKCKIKDYQFTEISEILSFLDFTRGGRQFGSCEYAYIRWKIGDCLKMHDDHSDHFIKLRELATELDFLIQK